VQQAWRRRAQLLRPRDEAQGSEAAPVVGLTHDTWILEGARVVTLDPGAPPATAVAIRGGRVLAVGTSTDMRRVAGRNAHRIACAGATVLPGLVDAHLHLFALATRQAHLDCSALRRVDDVLAAVRARAAETHDAEWIRGEGLDESRLGRLPTAAELDAASPRAPVRLRHRSRHASVLSGLGLARLGPRAGIERHAGRATGLVHGEERAVSRIVGRLPARVLADGLASTARELVALGLTTVADATPRAWRDLAPLRMAVDAGRVPVRVYAMRPPNARAWRGHGRLRPGPVKVMVEEGPSGLRPSPASLARRIALDAARGAVAVHCVGVSTLVATLDAFAALPRAMRSRHRHRLEHLAECPPSLVDRIRALGLTVVTNPAFVRERGDVYRTETQREAWGWLYRARSLLAAGVPLGAGSDAPVGPLSPWIGMAAARTRQTPSGAVLGAGERLSAAAALALFTRGAADALGAATSGRLRAGGPADLVVVEPDPLRAPPDEVAAARVRLTMIGGEIAWQG
jgi:predicted amidohydrolase YtcJ